MADLAKEWQTLLRLNLFYDETSFLLCQNVTFSVLKPIFSMYNETVLVQSLTDHCALAMLNLKCGD